MLPLVLSAMLSWNAIPGSGEVFLFYPSGGVVETVCIGDFTCWAPKSQVGELVPWEEEIEFVRATVRLPDGSRVHHYAYPHKEYIS